MHAQRQTWSLLERLGGAFVLGAILVLAAWRPAVATHSVPNPVWFWDLNNNAVADVADGLAAKYQKGGNLWDANKTNRFVEAAAQWSNGTDFNPTQVGTSVNVVYVDGRLPSCLDAWGANVVAVNCRTVAVHPNYVDIINSRLYLNENARDFWTGSGAGPATLFDMRGVFTHELGHSIRLTDLGGGDCPPGPTMCGAVHAGSESFNLRTITADDIAGANVVYP
jgi:hypothetical protein